jgi:hypothetical protein
MDAASIDIESDDIPLVGATIVIALGSLFVILGDAEGHPFSILSLVGGTVAFVWFALQRIEPVETRTAIPVSAMVLGSVLVGFDVPNFFEFDGPLGAALFMYGAVRLISYVET